MRSRAAWIARKVGEMGDEPEGVRAPSLNSTDTK
jgi:hypothetical protein